MVGLDRDVAAVAVERLVHDRQPLVLPPTPVSCNRDVDVHIADESNLSWTWKLLGFPRVAALPSRSPPVRLRHVNEFVGLPNFPHQLPLPLRQTYWHHEWLRPYLPPARDEFRAQCDTTWRPTNPGWREPSPSKPGTVHE